jgi:hypothetical protein
MIRRATLAGSWYPASASQCRAEIDAFEIGSDPSGQPRVIGGIVPHAGWYFSGHIAWDVIRQIGPRDGIDLLIVFGMHLPARASAVLMSSGSWQTPFGPIPVQEAVASAVAERFPCILETTERFNPENTIEVQLPMIRHALPKVSIVAIGVPASTEAISIGRFTAETAIRAGLVTRVLGSTDLTHYGPNYGFTDYGRASKAIDVVKREHDQPMIEAILSLDPLRVLDLAAEKQNACCSGAVAAAMAAATVLGASKARLVRYATSHERQASESFVGYAGICFETD